MTSERADNTKNDRKNDGGKNAAGKKSIAGKNAAGKKNIAGKRPKRAERRHRELMAVMIAAIGNGNNQGNGQSELIRTLQQTIEDLRAENETLRQQNGNGNSSQPS